MELLEFARGPAEMNLKLIGAAIAVKAGALLLPGLVADHLA